MLKIFHRFLPLLFFSTLTHSFTVNRKDFPLILYFKSSLNIEYEIRDLEDETSYLETEAAPWIIINPGGSTKTTQCSSIQLLGGYGITKSGTNFTRTYTSLVPHNQIQYSIQFYIIDMQYGTNLFKIYFNIQLLGTWSVGSLDLGAHQSAGNVCGGSQNEYSAVYIQGQVANSDTTLSLQILSSNNGVTDTFSFGFRKVNLLFQNATKTSTSTCTLTSTASLQSSCLCSAGYYDPAGLVGCTACNAACLGCQGSTAQDCTACNPGYSFDGTKCVQCASTCNQCSTSNTNQCLRCSSSDYLYWNKSCLSSCPSPLVQNTSQENSKLCSLPCGSSTYLYQNGTCASTCDTSAGFKIFTEGDLWYCNFTCSGGEFLYWNNSCIEACDNPLIQNTQGDIARYCELPCGLSSYFYQNGTCASTCETTVDFKVLTEGDLWYCNFTCSGNDFLYWNNSCNSTCDDPLIQNIQGDIARYCELPCGTSNYLYQNGTCTSTCNTTAGFKIFTEGDLWYCNFTCSADEFLYWNNSCYNTCPDPLVQNIQENPGRYCKLPCGLSGFLYQNNSCGSTCTTPFVPTNEGDLQYCNFSCPSTQWFYSNGSCLDTCEAPFTKFIQDLEKYCQSPCDLPNFYYPNQTCLDNCNENNFIQSNQGSIQYCDFVCPEATSPFLYPNDTCQNTCDPPLIPIQQGVAIYCQSPCQTTSEFINTGNGTCTLTCNLPYLQRLEEGGLKFCDTPCPPSNFLYWNGTCSAYCPSSFQGNQNGIPTCSFYCPITQYLYWNQTCKKTCPSPLLISIDQASYNSCGLPCSSTEYLHNNGSCLNQCGYQSYTDNNGIKICNYPCESTEFYDPDSSACSSTCITPMFTIISITINETLCVPKCLSDEFYVVENQTCQANCDPPLTQSIIGKIKICKQVIAIVCAAADPFPEKIIKITQKLNAVTNIFRPICLDSVFLFPLAKILKYIRYLDITLPDKVREAFDYSDTSDFSLAKILSIPLPENIRKNIADNPLPSVFERGGISSSYLKNIWNILSVISVTACLALILILLEPRVRSLPWKAPSLITSRLRLIYKWNFLAILFFNCYDDFTLYLILEIRTLSLQNLASCLSFIVCLITTFFALFFLFKLTTFCREWRKTQRQVFDQNSDQSLAFYKKWQYYQVLHAGYQHSSLSSKAFLLISTFRIIISYIFIGFLYKQPLAQVSLFILMNFGMFYLLIRKKPMKDLLGYTFNFAFETLIFAANICLFLIAVADLKSKELNSFKIKTSYAILVLTLMVCLLTMVYFFYCIVSCIYHCHKISKQTQPGTYPKTVWINILFCVYLHPGMQFDSKSNQDPEDSPKQKTKPSPLIHSLKKENLQDKKSVHPLPEYFNQEVGQDPQYSPISFYSQAIKRASGSNFVDVLNHSKLMNLDTRQNSETNNFSSDQVQTENDQDEIILIEEKGLVHNQQEALSPRLIKESVAIYSPTYTFSPKKRNVLKSISYMIKSKRNSSIKFGEFQHQILKNSEPSEALETEKNNLIDEDSKLELRRQYSNQLRKKTIRNKTAYFQRSNNEETVVTDNKSESQEKSLNGFVELMDERFGVIPRKSVKSQFANLKQIGEAEISITIPEDNGLIVELERSGSSRTTVNQEKIQKIVSQIKKCDQ